MAVKRRQPNRTSSGRPSPPAARVIGALEVFVAEPGRPRTLTEIAHAISATPATCLGILNELVGYGYLRRDEAKRYTLGTRAIGLGRAAAQGPARLDVVRPHLRALAVEVGLPATVAAVVDRQIVVLERVGDRRSTDFQSVGQRYPFAAPSGLVFVAWRPDRVVQSWLDDSPLVPSAVSPDLLWELVGSCRSRGYSVERFTDGVNLTYRVLAQLSPTMAEHDLIAVLNTVATTDLEVRYLLEDPKPRRRYAVNMIGAPVYDAEGNAVQLMAVYLQRRDVLGVEITRSRKALLRATAAATADLGGFDPWASS